MIKKLSLIALAVILLGLLTISICDSKIKSSAKGKTYSDLEKLPFNKVGLLLGTSKFLSSKNINPYYEYRIEAATSLIKSNKIKYLIISGDNSTQYYDEPTQMKKDLIANGIDSSMIYLDYAGFRTFDSVIRLREIFSQDSVTIISQEFHNQRALYIAGRENIFAVAYNAKDVSEKAGIKVQFREKLARVKVFSDYLFGVKPHFLGDKVLIPK